MSLLPCPGCARHIRTTESQCPFCARRIRSRRQSLFAVGAVAAVTACSSSSRAIYGYPGTDGPRDDAGQETGQFGTTDAGDRDPTDADDPTDSGDLDASDDADAGH